MTDKMREVPPITDETYKALMVALGMPNNRSLLSALQQIANHATQRAAWQAAKSEQSVPVVNQCDGCCRGLTVDDDGVHRSENGFPVMVCERPLYVAAELELLRKDAERWRAALVVSQAALCRPDTREPRVNSMLNAYMRAVNTGVGMTKAIDAAIAAEEEGE